MNSSLRSAWSRYKTGMAAVVENFNFIGIEKDASYLKIARARIKYAQEHRLELLRGDGFEAVTEQDERQVSLFDEESHV